MSGYLIFPSTKFKKDYKKFLNKVKELKAIQDTIKLLSQNGYESLHKEMKPHKLIGNFKGCYECHNFSGFIVDLGTSRKPKGNNIN